MSSPAISPDDRLPTFAETAAFDAISAWDHLTPAEQRRVGVLAVRLGVVGQRLNFAHDDFTADQRGEIEALEDKALQQFNDAVEPLWARLFGWIPSAAVTTKFLRMVS
jgi:hypothetical protein